METILKKPALHNYRIAHHLEYHKRSYAICRKYETVIQAPEYIDAYQETVEQEEYVFNWVRKSEFTKKKEQTNRRRDETCLGMLGIARSNLKHFDLSIRNSAAHVYNLLVNYGDLTNYGYDAQTVTFENLIARLRSDNYAEAVQTLGLFPWINELESQNEQFKSYVEANMREQVSKPNITTNSARRAADEALRKITSWVSAQIVINNPDVFAAFVEEFNVVVTHYNTVTRERSGRQHAQIDISPAEIETIAPQKFTGKHIFVIPELRMRSDDDKFINLVFCEDFTLEYRNNLNPGTATIIISGIGRYKGKIITTFNIVMNEQ